MKEKQVVSQFRVNTEIYNVELPQNIREILATDRPNAEHGIWYDMEVIFNKDVYSVSEFFQYPLSKDAASLLQNRNAKAEDIKEADIIGAILSDQLEKVVKQVESLGFSIGSAAIIGDKKVDLHTLEVTIFKGAEKVYTKKGNVEDHLKLLSIIPDRPYLQDRAVEVFSQIFLDMMKDDNRKQYELSQHIPNNLTAREVFDAVAHAIQTDMPNNHIETDVLSDKLRTQAVIKSNWPLRIESDPKIDIHENLIEAATQIDCPEYLLYHAYLGERWTLEKVINLRVAQQIITKVGYNQKRTTQIIVLHNLQIVPFTLYEDTEDGLVQVNKEEAAGKKKLMISWNK